MMNDSIKNQKENRTIMFDTFVGLPMRYSNLRKIASKEYLKTWHVDIYAVNPIIDHHTMLVYRYRCGICVGSIEIVGSLKNWCFGKTFQIEDEYLSFTESMNTLSLEIFGNHERIWSFSCRQLENEFQIENKIW